MKLLGIDYGGKRVGVAWSNGTYAVGLAEFATNEAVTRLKALCRTYPVELVVIGLPEGKLEGRVRQFGANLREELACRIRFWDETLTSQSAQDLLVYEGIRPKKRRQKEHQTAAAILLQSYIDAKMYSLHR